MNNQKQYNPAEINETKDFISRSWLSFTKPTPRNFEKWAEENIVLGESEALPGAFSISRTEPVRQIMQSFTNPKVNQIYIMSATQMFKTQFLINTLLYCITERPSNIMFAMPTQKLLKPFIRGRFERMCQQSVAFSHLIADLKVNKDIGGRQTQDVKYFTGGMLQLVSGESQGGLTSTPARVVLLDEVDKFADHNVIDEASSRGKNYPDFKIVASSSPETRDKSIIADLYETSNKMKYHFKCPDCKQFFEPNWEHVKYEVEASALITDSVIYACPSCGSAWDDSRRWQAVANGRWIAERPVVKTVHGYHISSLASQMSPLHRVVQKYILAKEKEAMGEFSPIRRFYKDDMAIPWGDGTGDLDHHKVASELCLRAWDDNNLPNEILTITAAVDVQSNRFEIEWAGWGKENKRFGLKFLRLFVPPPEKTSWNKLKDILDKYRFFKREDGVEIKCSVVFIDSGGHYTKECYLFTSYRGDMRVANPKNALGFFPIKGKGGEGVSIIHSKKWNDEICNELIILGVDEAKGFIIDSINHSLEQGRQSWQWNSNAAAGYDRDYFISLCAERRELVVVDGRRKTKYKLRKNKLPNEGFDLAVYSYSGLCMRAGNSQQVEDYLDELEKRLSN